jgi:hypothetical protein
MLNSVFRQAEVAQLRATLTQRENDLLAAVHPTTTSQPPVSNYYYYSICKYVFIEVQYVLSVCRNRYEQIRKIEQSCTN